MRSTVLACLFALFAVPAWAHPHDKELPEILRIGPDHFNLEIGALRGGRLGVQVSSMTEELRTAMGAPADQGLLVNRVFEDSAARKAGVQPGDVLVEVAGEPIEEVADVWRALANKEGEVAVEVIRDKRRLNLTAKIERNEGPNVHLFSDPAMRREMDELRAKIKSLEKRLEKLEKR